MPYSGYSRELCEIASGLCPYLTLRSSYHLACSDLRGECMPDLVWPPACPCCAGGADADHCVMKWRSGLPLRSQRPQPHLGRQAARLRPGRGAQDQHAAGGRKTQCVLGLCGLQAAGHDRAPWVGWSERCLVAARSWAVPTDDAVVAVTNSARACLYSVSTASKPLRLVGSSMVRAKRSRA